MTALLVTVGIVTALDLGTNIAIFCKLRRVSRSRRVRGDAPADTFSSAEDARIREIAGDLFVQIMTTGRR